ncbi:MAG: hypothetical protein KIT33_09110 [Candidatus Kapabacteria bacterium]|nr:hypothetical protein [Ignavibacteriota bacterium]MCW5885116.1 hypothetical protein [Candidatus Kapabacteria bacterium]
MKKMYLKFLSVLFLYSAIACSGDINNSTDFNIDKNLPNLFYDTLGVSFPLNPYDSIGLIHNNGLNYISNNISSLTCQNHRLELVSLISYSLDSLGYQYNINQINQQVNLIFDNPGIVELDSVTYYYSFERDVERHLLDLIDIFRNHSDSTNISSLLILIKDWEFDIINSNLLSTSQKEQLLVGGAVARYSMAYWYDVGYVNSVTNPWYHELNCNQFEKNSSKIDKIQLFGFFNWPKWAKVVATAVSDAVGAAAGVAAGAGTPASVGLGIQYGVTASGATAALMWIKGPGE